MIICILGKLHLLTVKYKTAGADMIVKVKCCYIPTALVLNFRAMK